MKQFFVKYIIVLSFVAIMLCGCSAPDIGGLLTPGAGSDNPADTSKWPDNVLLTINGIESDYREAMLYLLSAKEEAELLYGEGIWELVLDEKGTTYGALRKEQILEEYINFKIVCAHAEEYGVITYEEENRDIAEYTSAFMSKVGKENLLAYGISENIVKTLYKNNMLANKLYETVTLSVDTLVSDEEAHRAKIQYIFRKKYTVSDNGEKVSLSEESIKALRESVQKLRDTAVKKSDFLSYAQINTEADTVELSVGANTLDAELSAVVLALTDGQLSEVVETEEGFYIFKCILAFDEDATMAYKEEIIEKRRVDYFNSLYESWKANAVIVIDNKKWESINP